MSMKLSRLVLNDESELVRKLRHQELLRQRIKRNERQMERQVNKTMENQEVRR